MKTYININNNYGEKCECTLADLQELSNDNGWDAEFTETYRFIGDTAVDIIVDDRNEVVAVLLGYENESW